MAATFVTSRSRVFGNARCLLNQSSNHHSSFTSIRKKQSNVAFLLGFGLAGFVGFSGILYGKKQKKRITATSIEKDSLAVEENCSSQSVSNIEETSRKCCSSWTLQSAIEESQSIIRCMKEETGSPGVCVAVSIDGKTVWNEGFGFADVENRVLCSSKTVMRIASISKPLTATAAAKLWEDGKLDLDVPIQKYVASFPEKTFRGTPVTLTARHLLSHLGGRRDYHKNKPSHEENKTENQSTNSNASKEQVMASTDTRQSGTTRKSCTCTGQSDSREEFYIKDHYDTVTEALSIFKDDPLLSDPGSSYLYTTFGWTLLSAVIEGASGQDFLSFMNKLFKELGMENTRAEFNDRIIYNRARFYQRNNKGHLVNAPYVDNSLKWGGGGFMSNGEDLVEFGNSMLYAKQMSCVNKENCGTTGYLPGFLKPETVSELWKIVTNTEGKGHKDGGYGLGWVVIPEKQDFGSCYHQSETVFHSGGAVGASSILLIRPHHVHNKPPKGVVVALLVNLQQVNLEKTAMDVAACFEKTKL